MLVDKYFVFNVENDKVDAPIILEKTPSCADRATVEIFEVDT